MTTSNAFMQRVDKALQAQKSAVSDDAFQQFINEALAEV